ncbi:type II/IV secretion system protein [Patescibacteria group bacterium]|nr:MAG: type II/IV secretion system protein [Patescibacteria group bacterium]
MSESTGASRAQDEQLAAAFAAKSGIPYQETTDLTAVIDLGGQLDLATLQQYRVAPLHHYNDHSLELGITDQTDRSRLPELQNKLPHVQMTFKTISHSGYNYILNHTYYLLFEKERNGDFKAFGKRLAAAAPKQAFSLIAQMAYWLDASDIHIEPQANQTRIRFRLDGILHPITDVDTKAYEIFLSDLQTRAEITWGSDEPQSGRISLRLMDNQALYSDVNMRIETVPTFHGEEIVVRIFNDQTRDLTLEHLGFSDEQLRKLYAVTEHPSGMVLTVGPTGSGKTSTLYAIINHLNNPEVKIITLEDPVEYDLPGISQIQVNTDDKESFAGKLRAVMREDPNVVMIGEIRDIDTAKTALQAALTGHLVLSTFHATNASAAISRMLDMIGQNPLFASAIRMIIAQRLARRICPHCVVEATATKEQLDFLTKSVEQISPERRPKLPKTLKLKHGKGCPECHGIGYKGRVAVVEMMSITPEIEKLMMQPKTTTAQDIEAVAVRSGMATLLEDGVTKALAGETTVEEIVRLSEA